MKKTPVIFSVLLATGCAAPIQSVKPVTEVQRGTELCIIENPDVRAGFISAYQAALRDKGVNIKMLPPHAKKSDCNLTSTYTANWRWDLAMYMSYAKISVYRDDWLHGEALYDASATASLDKFIDADYKIREMVNDLFPGSSSVKKRVIQIKSDGLLGSAELKVTFSGKTADWKHLKKGYTATGYFAPNGTLKGLKNGSDPFEKEWSVNKKGELCIHKKGNKSCRIIERSGAEYKKIKVQSSGDRKHIVTYKNFIDGNPNDF